MVGIYNGACKINGDKFSVDYKAHKRYLGRDRILPQTVSMNIDFIFDDRQEMRDFFVFWENETSMGAKPFYVELPLYGETKYYLILLDGDLTQSYDSKPVVGGSFILYRNRTLDENIAPIFNNKNVSVDMDSTNNYLLFQADDFDTLVYEIITSPINGILQDVGNGAYYYTPNDGFSGYDSFRVKATDELGTFDEATLNISIINWQLDQEFKTNISSINELLIIYANAANVDAQIQQDLLTLANATISYDTAGNTLLDYSNCNTITNVTIDNNNNLIITTS